MSDIYFEIEEYNMHFLTESSVGTAAIIRLTNPDGVNHVRLHFMDSVRDVMPAHENSNNRGYTSYYHRDRFPEIVDLLRNEGPLTCVTYTNVPENGHILIYSGAEPIGEGEL